MGSHFCDFSLKLQGITQLPILPEMFARCLLTRKSCSHRSWTGWKHEIHIRMTSATEAAESQTLSVGSLPFLHLNPRVALQEQHIFYNCNLNSALLHKIFSGKLCPPLHLCICVLYESLSGHAPPSGGGLSLSAYNSARLMMYLI